MKFLDAIYQKTLGEEVPTGVTQLIWILLLPVYALVLLYERMNSSR